MIIEGIVGSNIYGDIAIDDFFFLNGVCGLFSVKVRFRLVIIIIVLFIIIRIVIVILSEKINF